MKHIYGDGRETEVAAEYAERMVRDGFWRVCTATHTFDKNYEGQEITVYHRDTEHTRNHPRTA